jgi:hypothetical protein
MNKIKLLISILLNILAVQLVYSQWSTTLNPAPIAGGLFFGTNGAYPLRIYTDNENRMHINQNLSYSVNSQPGKRLVFSYMRDERFRLPPEPSNTTV